MGRKASFEELREEAQRIGVCALTLHCTPYDSDGMRWFARCDLGVADTYGDTAHLALVRLVRALRVPPAAKGPFDGLTFAQRFAAKRRMLEMAREYKRTTPRWPL